MKYESVEQHVRRIMSGAVKKVSFSTADRFCVALGQEMPASLWGQEWQDASPPEIYGDESFDF